MESLLFYLFLLLFLGPLPCLSDSSAGPARTPPPTSTSYSSSDFTTELNQSTHLAANAPELPPSDHPDDYITKPFPYAQSLVSFTGGKGNYPSMAREFLSAHNEVRAAVQELPFAWDKQLARFARRWAEKQRAGCHMEHSMGPYGENLFWGSGWSWRATDAVREWAKEQNFYNPADNSCSPGQMCGHFTQIIWKSTVRIGCGRSECPNGGVIITCNYDPPGNYVGENPLTASIP